MSSMLDEVVPTFGIDRQRALGFFPGGKPYPLKELALIKSHANLQMIANGLPAALSEDDEEIRDVTATLLESYQQQSKLLQSHRPPVDARIEAFLASYFEGIVDNDPLKLPSHPLEMEKHGMARTLSLPADSDHYENELVDSFRIKNGVLHNPRHDRRTTKGTFHVCEGGLPIAGDKRAVPREVFVKLFRAAMHPPAKYLAVPFTSQQLKQAETFVSLYLRPLVCPELPGVSDYKNMEVRFFVPGSLVSNLDFVESIFGNAGNPNLPANDAGLDVKHWTGHTGCVILAPQMLDFTKKELGLPHYDDATDRQKRDSMCWRDENELYNDGMPFKLTCRNEMGVVVTLIADNYFGYCKKEVKTQISYATNLYGGGEEEHAGGAIAYPSYNLGEKFKANSIRYNNRTFEDVIRDYASFIEAKPEGYGVDRYFPGLIYIPEDAEATLRGQRIRWSRNGETYEIPLLPGKVYMAPSGYQLHMEKHPSAPSWRLIGTVAEGTFCHKPCTVSGGGKSEISKSLIDFMHYGPLFVSDVEHDFDMVDQIFKRDYSTRWNSDSREMPDYSQRSSRPILGPNRSLGSVIKLLTPSREYNEEYNDWLKSIPDYIFSLVYIIKRFEEPGWEDTWRNQFGVDIINGHPGHELKFRDRTLVGTYLRVGFYGPQKWRTHKLRQDFSPSVKVQTEDDISVSTVVPHQWISGLADHEHDKSLKFLVNCEYRLFQRPDEAIHRGFDKQAESDLAQTDNFISNFEPLTKPDIEKMAEYVADFDAFSQPMQDFLSSMLKDETHYVVCSANPRKVDGKPSKNPRYLQDRPDMVAPFKRYACERATRLFRAVPVGDSVPTPVSAVLLGRRNNPPEKEAGIRGLAVYNPIHYQELPELFMDFMSSLTGKSPSTTGFGSEGAMTKGPFNALLPAADLNSAFLSYVLTGLGGYSSAAGHVGPHVQVDHDISLLVPEIWCRLSPREQNPDYLISEGCLQKLDDVEHNGKTIPVSRLGYRITARFVRRYFGRIFDHPGQVFDQKILQPELQDRDAFLDGIEYIAIAHKQTADQYLSDGTYELLCPPLRALVKVMAEGTFEGKTVHDPEFRAMFARDEVLRSDWYQERLKAKQHRDVERIQHFHASVFAYINDPINAREVEELKLRERMEWLESQQEKLEHEDYLATVVGTLGVQPRHS